VWLQGESTKQEGNARLWEREESSKGGSPTSSGGAGISRRGAGGDFSCRPKGESSMGSGSAMEKGRRRGNEKFLKNPGTKK